MGCHWLTGAAINCLTMAGSARGSKWMSEIKSTLPEGLAGEEAAELGTLEKPSHNKMRMAREEGQARLCFRTFLLGYHNRPTRSPNSC